MQPLAEPASEKHLAYLDSARGIAALMVFTMHFFERKYAGTPTNTYISIFINGRDAVSFFFVLSGFVLSYKYIILKKQLDPKKFYVSRLFRLWPAYFIAVLLNCLYLNYHNNNDSLTFQKLLDIFVYNKHQFWEEALLFRFHNNYFGPGWTLTIEMVGSFFLPFMIVIAIKNKKLIPWVIFALLVAAGQNFFALTHFLLGLLVCCYYPMINKEDLSRNKWFKYRYLLLILAFVLFPFRYYDNIKPFGPTYYYLANYIGFDTFVLSGAASAIFLVTIIYNDWLKKILSNKVLVYTGKLSFAIYLAHTVTLAITYDYLQKYFPPMKEGYLLAGMMVIYAILTLVLAMLIHYIIELPFIKVGKRVSGKMKPSIIITT